jgi:hypothetical protein
MLQGVLVAPGGPGAGAVHPTDTIPLTAGAWHRNPLRFDLAWHLNAWCIGQCMGLFLRFFPRPYPLAWRVHVATSGANAGCFVGHQDAGFGHDQRLASRKLRLTT